MTTRSTDKLNDATLPESAAGHELAMGLRRAYLALHRVTNARLVECGVTADQFVVLAALAEHGPVTQTQLGERTFSDSNTISAMLGRMQKLGYITRKRSRSDARFRVASLTRRGRTMLAKCTTATEAVRARVANQLQSARLREFTAYLKGLAALLEQQHSSWRNSGD